VYNPATDTWTARSFTEGPGNRSVATFLSHPSYPDTKAILFFGEKSPSNDGHNAAGTFWDDIWIYDFVGDMWERAIIENGHFLNDGGLGWASGAVVEGENPATVVIWGGLNERNERFGMGWKILIGR